MRVLGAGLILLFLGASPWDAKKDLKNAVENTQKLDSYFYQKNLELKAWGRTQTQGGAGEYVAPDAMTYRSSIFEAAMNGEKIIYKDKNEWKEFTSKTRSPYARNIRSLKPPHKGLEDFLDTITKPKRDYSMKRNKKKKGEIKYIVIKGTIEGDDIKDALKALGGSLGSVGRSVEYEDAKLDVIVLIHPELKVIHKIEMTGKLPLKATFRREASEADYMRRLEFHNWNETTLGLAASEKKLLGFEGGPVNKCVNRIRRWPSFPCSRLPV